jgi:serine/threonine protein kinase
MDTSGDRNILVTSRRLRLGQRANFAISGLTETPRGCIGIQVVSMSGDLQRLPNLEAILRPGQMVGGRYRADKLIAEGGMAAVWAGHNERTGKRVALKVILQSMATVGEAAELFRGEALAASKINHPNVVSIFDVVDHGSMTCIVMELLDGETLDVYLARNGPLSLQEAVALLLPAMRGVAAAHVQGVVHRDLKPGNIFLCSDADGRLLTTKVLDFGIATMMGRADASAIATDLLARMGTPTYMSPEAIQCSPNIDGRTDVYGFGVLFFEALTGKVPFPGEPGTELYARILDDPPPKVTEYRTDLPPEVGPIVDRALAKNADERFPDMEHFIRAVEEQLLPPSQMPRALTPMQGTIPVQLVESKSDAASATVGAVINNEPSGPGHKSKTRVLFSLTGLPGFGGNPANFPSRKRLKKLDLVAIVNQARRLLAYFTGLGRHLRQRTAILAGFAVVFVVAAYLAIAARPNHGDMGKQGSSSSFSPVPARVPQVIPLATTSKPAPSLTASSPDIVTIRPVADFSPLMTCP